jgi:hypothetical protein
MDKIYQLFFGGNGCVGGTKASLVPAMANVDMDIFDS